MRSQFGTEITNTLRIQLKNEMTLERTMPLQNSTIKYATRYTNIQNVFILRFKEC